MRVISGPRGLTPPGFPAIALQEGDEFEDAEDDQAEPRVYQRAEIDFKRLVARGERKIREEGIIESISQQNDYQPTEISFHIFGHPSSASRKRATTGASLRLRSGRLIRQGAPNESGACGYNIRSETR